MGEADNEQNACTHLDFRHSRGGAGQANFQDREDDDKIDNGAR